jgi:diguanylate cyclase (GGDEF)-like protein
MSSMRQQLDSARLLVESGEFESARGVASAVLKEAEYLGDRMFQGHALLALAQVDRVLGHFRRALETAQRASHLYQLEGDFAGEAAALSLLAHANSYLGRDEEAVEAALLSVKLGNMLPPGALQVNLYNYLGVTYLWARSFSNAEGALFECERLALLNGPESSVLLPRVNLAWLEAIRLFKERYFTGALPSTELLRERLQLCTALFDEGAPFSGLPGVRSVLQRFGRCAQALSLCWSGNLDAAREALDAVQDQSRPDSYAEVANFFGHWVLSELSLATGDVEAARREAEELIRRADQSEFEQMAYIGHLLLTHIYRQQGLYELALDEGRKHRRRELRVQADILESRHSVVQTQLDIRASEHHLRQMVRNAQELERLSFEDALTGLPNRRRFEKQLASALGYGWVRQHPVCVALLDLDDFKRVNDAYTHAAGDEVLKAVSQAIRNSVRESDLPARLGGDEFVILFHGTTLETARLVCERIHSAVADLRWDHLSPSLRTCISIGVTEARPGDSPEELLHRSDLAMFGAKPKA